MLKQYFLTSYIKLKIFQLILISKFSRLSDETLIYTRAFSDNNYPSSSIINIHLYKLINSQYYFNSGFIITAHSTV